MTGEKYVLLDRDGVINEDSDDFIKSPDEWTPLPGSLEAIALLNRHGFKIVVITNQSGVKRGLFDSTALNRMHEKMHRLAAEHGGRIEAVYYCPHGPDDGCECRKPKPGLLKQFAAEHHVDLTDLYFVGDTLKDIQTATAVNARPLLVKTGKGLKTLTEHPEITIPVFANLYEAAHYIIETG